MAHKSPARRKLEQAQEDILFQNSFEVTLQQLKDRRKLSQKRSGKAGLWVDIFFEALFGVVAVMSLPLAILAPTPVNILVAVIFVGVFIFLVTRAPRTQHKQFKPRALVKGGPKTRSPWIQTIRFGESIVVDNGGTTTKYPYGGIRFIEENDECFYLWYGAGRALAVYKNAFTKGDAEEFKPFIFAKCSQKEALWSNRELNRRIVVDQISRAAMLVSVAVLLIGFLVFHLVTDLR